MGEYADMAISDGAGHWCGTTDVGYGLSPIALKEPKTCRTAAEDRGDGDEPKANELVESYIDAIAEQIIWHVHAHPGHKPDIYGEEAAAEIIYERSVKPCLREIERLNALVSRLQSGTAK